MSATSSFAEETYTQPQGTLRLHLVRVQVIDTAAGANATSLKSWTVLIEDNGPIEGGLPTTRCILVWHVFLKGD